MPDLIDRPVLAGVDGSVESFAALGLAATEASLRQAPLLVTHVWAGPHWRPVRTGGEPTSRADAERLLAAATGWLRRHHPRVPVCGQLPLGEPAEVLAGESGTADLVVVGHRGTGHAAGGWGSVAARLSDTCDAPLLVRVFRPRAGEPPTGAPVVVAVPAAAPSPSLIGFAFEEAARHGAPLAACHVWPAAPLPADAQARRAGTAALAAPTDAALVPAAARELLADALAGWSARYPQVRVQPEVRLGPDVAAALAAAARRARLLVVGAGRDGGLPEIMRSTVPRSLLRLAECPVAVVPDRAVAMPPDRPVAGAVADRRRASNGALPAGARASG